MGRGVAQSQEAPGENDRAELGSSPRGLCIASRLLTRERDWREKKHNANERRKEYCRDDERPHDGKLLEHDERVDNKSCTFSGYDETV